MKCKEEKSTREKLVELRDIIKALHSNRLTWIAIFDEVIEEMEKLQSDLKYQVKAFRALKEERWKINLNNYLADDIMYYDKDFEQSYFDNYNREREVNSVALYYEQKGGRSYWM